MCGPTPAEQARTALAEARVAVLRTRGCRSGSTTTLVGVTAADDGTPSLWLVSGSPMVPLVSGGRLVSLRVAAPSPYRSLELSGPLERADGHRPGHQQFRMRVLAVRLLGAAGRTVLVQQYAAAKPDPLRSCAAAMVRHLEQSHVRDLLACVHAQGLHDVQAVVPRGVDRYGITMGALCHDGVRSLRLEFPGGPVDSLEQVAPGLRGPLTCRCRPEPQG